MRTEPDATIPSGALTDASVYQRAAGSQGWAVGLEIPYGIYQETIWPYQKEHLQDLRSSDRWTDLALVSLEGEVVGVLRHGNASLSFHVGDFESHPQAQAFAREIATRVSEWSFDPEALAALRTGDYIY